MIGTKLNHADLTGAHVYGVSVWDIELTDAVQRDLVITPPNASEITVDNLEVAQFLYLLITNAKLRQVIDTITAKVVLILGTFLPTQASPGRRAHCALRFGLHPSVIRFHRTRKPRSYGNCPDISPSCSIRHRRSVVPAFDPA